MTVAASPAARPLAALAAAVRSRPLGDALVSALLIVVGAPRLWVVALAGFLVRSGLLLLMLPIVVLPSPIQLAAAFGLDAVSISGEPTARFVQEVALALLGLGLWALGAGIAGAAVEIVVARDVAGDGYDELESSASGEVGPRDSGAPGPAAATDKDGAADSAPIAAASHEAALPGAIRPATGPRSTGEGEPPGRGRLLARLLLARLLTLVPLVLALAWGVGRVLEVGYREVTVPSDTAIPLVLRIATGAADAVVAILVTWLLTELLHALATRHLLFDVPEGRSADLAVRVLLRRPVPVLVAFLVGTAASALALGAALAAVSIAWDRVLFEFRESAGLVALAATALLVLTWGATLVLAGFLSALRSALMTGAYLWTMAGQDAGRS